MAMPLLQAVAIFVVCIASCLLPSVCADGGMNQAAPLPRRGSSAMMTARHRSQLEYLSSNSLECVCDDVSLCAPLKTPLPEKEIYAFQVTATNWPYYDWTRVTSIIMYDGLDPGMLCMAHALNVRVIWAQGPSVEQVTNTSWRDSFLNWSVAAVVNSFTDGINLDFESAIPENDTSAYNVLTELTVDLNQRLKAAVPSSSFAFDVAWSANHIDGRYYNYSAIASACDFVVIMDYDTRSQVFSGPPCYGGPNSPASTLFGGVESYLELGIPPSKLVYGVPWYGYLYECLNLTNVTSTECPIASVPFRGVACSDAAGSQYNYRTIMHILRNASTQLFTPVIVNTSMSTDGSFVTFSFNNSARQTTDPPVGRFYFDNPETLQGKYLAAKELGLRGVSMWNVDAISTDRSGPAAEDSKAMWHALDSFVVLSSQ